MKYDPAENGDNQSFVQTIVQDFANRGVRMDRVVLVRAAALLLPCYGLAVLLITERTTALNVIFVGACMAGRAV
jgi:hypothetical protein